MQQFFFHPNNSTRTITSTRTRESWAASQIHIQTQLQLQSQQYEHISKKASERRECERASNRSGNGNASPGFRSPFWPAIGVFVCGLTGQRVGFEVLLETTAITMKRQLTTWQDKVHFDVGLKCCRQTRTRMANESVLIGLTLGFWLDSYTLERRLFICYQFDKCNFLFIFNILRLNSVVPLLKYIILNGIWLQ